MLLRVIAAYLFLGMVAAYWNFSNTRRRETIVEKMNKLRMEIFKEGLNVQITISDSVRKIGFGEDEVSESLNNEDRIALSPFGLTKIIAVAFILLGPITFSGLWRERESLKEIETTYAQMASLIEPLLAVKKETA